MHLLICLPLLPSMLLCPFSCSPSTSLLYLAVFKLFVFQSSTLPSYYISSCGSCSSCCLLPCTHCLPVKKGDCIFDYSCTQAWPCWLPFILLRTHCFLTWLFSVLVDFYSILCHFYWNGCAKDLDFSSVCSYVCTNNEFPENLSLQSLQENNHTGQEKHLLSGLFFFRTSRLR